MDSLIDEAENCVLLEEEVKKWLKNLNTVQFEQVDTVFKRFYEGKEI
jgi:hypothetical protein